MQEVQPILFWIIAGLTGLSAILTLLTQNIVRSATWLLFTLAGVAGVMFLLAADLVGAIQIMVYVGGTLVLVVFGVMLTAQGPFINMKASSAEWAISVTVGSLLLGVLIWSVATIGQTHPGQDKLSNEAVFVYGPQSPSAKDAKGVVSSDVASASYSSTIGQGFLGVGVGPAHKDGKSTIRMTYLLPFELVSVHLLVVLIGAAYLGRAKRRRREVKT